MGNGGLTYYEEAAEGLPGAYDPSKVITREQWGAGPPNRECKDLKLPISKVRYGYTLTPMCYNVKQCSKIIRELQEDHIDVGCPDIVHNFLVGADGNIYEGRGWFKESCIPEGQWDLEGRTLDVALIGPFNERKVPKNMIDVCKTIVNYGVENKYLTEPYDAEQYPIE